MSMSHVIDGIQKFPIEQKDKIIAEVDRYVVQFNVPAETPADLIRREWRPNVRYLQIDVEGIDNLIVEALPFGEDGFLPKMILFEQTAATVKQFPPILAAHGYETCCCVQIGGGNLLAVQKSALEKGSH